MWGCIRVIFLLGILVTLLLVISGGGGYLFLGTEYFANKIRLRVEQNLEAHLGREVTIKSVTLIRSYPQRVILRGVTIANAPGASNPYFATVREAEVSGGVDSLANLLGRRISLGRIDIRDPKIFFEVFPEGAPLVHNFPSWKPSAPRKYQIVRIDVRKMFVTGGAFEFLDRRHDVRAEVFGLASEITPTFSKQIYEGAVGGGRLQFRIQDYEPMELALRGRFRYEPGSLALSPVRLSGPGTELIVTGKLQPLTQGVYNLGITSQIDLARVREMFRVEKNLEGTVSIDGRLKGRQGVFALEGGFVVPEVTADTYDLTNLRGRLAVTNDKATVDIESGEYGGGAISGQYRLAKYAEPYPMSVDLRYDGISLEKLFDDWNLKETGLRGAAVGTLRYEWSKDRILAGSGEGSATLRRGARAFGNARYPIAIGGNTDFRLDRGVITFRPSELVTERSRIGFDGTLRIEDLFSNLQIAIRSSDFSELDRIAFNFARSAGEEDYKLLGLGGSGTIDGTVRGTIRQAQVAARVSGSGTKYNNVLLGESQIVLRYDGRQSTLTFEEATFRDGSATLALRGTVAFPKSGPSPRFDISLNAAGYPTERALDAVGLNFKARGAATGGLTVSGTPEQGVVRFADLRIRRADSNLNLSGDIAWLPGKGNVNFDLAIGATGVPIEEIATFLDLGTVPVSGEVTGTLHLEGPKKTLEGAGSVFVANGKIMGEPVESATADLLFTKGKLKASNVTVKATAGTVKGEADFDFEAENFSYIIQSSEIDLSKVTLLSNIKDFLGGKVRLTSSGAGTFDDPELVVEATITEGTLQGMSFPKDAPAPSFFLSLKGGELKIRGSAFDAASIEGNGTLAPDGSLGGLVQIKITNVAKFVALFPSSATLPAEGELTIDLQLGGKIKSLESLQLDGSVPVLNVKFSDHRFTAAEPIRFRLRAGVVAIDSFRLLHEGSEFTMDGTVSLTGSKQIGLNMRGRVEAALLQLFAADLQADGHLNIVAEITGTTDKPVINGTAEIQDAELKIAGVPQLIDDITGTLEFKGERVEIDSLKATVGGGTLSAGGSVVVEGLELKRVSLKLQGTDVSIRYFEGVTVDGDLELGLTGDLERMLLQGNVTVNRALYYKDFDFARTIVERLLESRGLIPEVAASWQDRVNLDVDLVTGDPQGAPETLSVKNNIADVTGSAEIHLTGTLAKPVILGLVTIDEGGKVRFQDNDYTVVRGTINFQNPFRIDPYFDITLEGRVQISEAEGPTQTTDLTINLAGTLDKIQPTFTADPSISQFSVLSLLGSRGFGQSGGGALDLQSLPTAGQSILVQSLSGLIGSRIFSFADNFRLDLGGDTTSTKLTFEKRISDTVRVILVYYPSEGRRGAQQEYYVEWQLTPEWVIQFSREAASDISSDPRTRVSFNLALDGKFRRRYEGHWGAGAARDGQNALVADKDGKEKPAALDESATETAPRPRPPGDGPVIRSVSFQPDSAFAVEQLAKLIPIRPGDPYSIREIQRSIETLFGTGDFRDIQVDATAAGKETDLKFLLSLNYRIARVDLEGLGKEERARKDITVRSGDILRLAAIDRNAATLQKNLGNRGYLESTVDPETIFTRDRNEAVVVFHVTLGGKATVSDVVFEGDLAPFNRDELLKVIKRRPGRAYRLDDARRDADRIENLMIRRKYRKAEVRYLGERYDKEADSVVTRYRVNVGTLVRVEVAGVTRRSIRKLIPFGRNEGYSQDVIQTAVDRIVEYYQLRGHFLATVDTDEKLLGEEWVITFEVQPGRKYEIGEVRFAGNQQISDKKLRGVIAAKKPGGLKRIVASLLRRPGGVTRETLSGDRDALENLYKLEGFTEAVVSSPTTATTGGMLIVTFPIVEGPQTRVTEVVIEGNTQVPASKLPDPQLEPNRPLNPIALNDDIVALQTFYAERGNAEVQVKPTIDFNADKTGAKLTYRIAEGPRIAFGDIIARGNTYTDSYVILRKAGLEPGEPFNFRTLFEAQRDLYRLGIFQRVDLQHDAAGMATSTRNVVIQVEEGKDLTVAGAIGYASEDGARTSVSVSHRNLFGTARYLGFDTSISNRVNRYSITYREPFPFKLDLPTQFTIYKRDEKNINVEGTELRIQRSGAFIEVARVFREQTRWSVRYEYRVIDTACTAQNDPDGSICAAARGSIDPRDDEVRISSITPSFFWDKRDDAIDPRRGFFATTSLEYAFPFLTGGRSASDIAFDNVHFLKLYSQGAWYRPITRRTLLAVSGRLGLIEPFDGGQAGSIPFAEQFVAGGDSSHRAFALDQLGILGPRGDDPCRDPLPRETLRRDCNAQGEVTRIFARGGNGLLILNAEGRFPIFGSLNGALFVDAGNVWREIGQIETGDLRYGVGAGIRYLTPVGPIRVDYGYKLRREQDESPYVISIAIGYAF